MEKNQSLFFYFKNSLYFLFTNKFIVIIHLLIEFLDIYSYTLDTSIQLLHYNEKYIFQNNNISKYLFYISPFYYYHTYIHSKGKSSNLHCTIGLIIIIILLIFYLLMIFNQSNIKYSKVSFCQKIFISFFINFYDYLFFRTLSIIPLHIINENILIYAQKSMITYNSLDIFLLLLLVVLGILVLVLYIKYYHTFNILSTFKFHETCFNNYPFDHFFSMKYDMILLFVKLAIVTSHNYQITHQFIISFFVMFVNCISLCLIFGLSLRLLYHFFIDQHELSNLFLNESNVLRLFLLEFTSVSIVLRMMFNTNASAVLFLSFCLMILVLLLYIIYTNYSSYIISKAEISDNYLGVCWFFQSNDIDRNKFIMQWIIHHRSICFTKNCYICLKINEDDGNMQKNDSDNEGKLMKAGQLYSPYDFVNTLYQEEKRMTHEHSRHSAQFFIDFVYLTLLYLTREEQVFKLYSFISKLKRRYQNNLNVLLSVDMAFELIRKTNKDKIKAYKLIRKGENLNNSVRSYINAFESFIHYESKTPENFFKIANKFKEIKNNRKILIEILKKDPKCNYQTRILRFVYETILRSPLNIIHNESELLSSEEFIDYHYKSDQLCLLKYCIERGTFTIIKGSRDILPYKGKTFDSLFPEYLRKKGTDQFIDKLRNCDGRDNKRLFSFVIKDLQQPEELGFIQDFKMAYSVYPSTTTDEMLISITYLVDYDDILIFEISSESKEEYLYACSKSFFKILGLTTEMIQILSKAYKKIAMEDLFSKQLFNLQSGSNCCQLKYCQYALLYRDLIKYDILIDAYNFQEIKDFQHKIIEFGAQRKEISFLITEKFTDENAKTTYIIYNLSEMHKEKDVQKMKEMTIIAEGLDILVDPVGKFDAVQTMTYAPTISNYSANSCSSANRSLAGGMNRRRSHRDSRKEKYQQVQYFTLLIFFFGIFLMGMTLLFLILEVNKNLTFQTLFNLFQSFKVFKRAIECIPLSIISNFCLEKMDGTCKNHYKEYSNQIKLEYVPLAEFPNLNEIISAEIMEKYGTIILNFNNFLTEMYQLNFDNIDIIGTFKLPVLNIKKTGDSLEIEKTESTFVDLVRLYSNFVTTILTDNAYLNTGVRIIIISDDGKIHSEDKEITQIQRHLYRLILNYPYLHQGIMKSSSIIEEEFSIYLKEIDSILIGFFFSLLFLHLLLCFIAVWFLRTFIQMLKSIIGSIINLFSDHKYIEFIDTRMKAISQICDLYSENPIKIIQKISQQEEDYKKAQRDLILNQKNDNNNTLSNSIPIKPKTEYQITEKEFNKVIIKYQLGIIILFTVYIIYSIIYYILINHNYINLEYLVKYSSYNSLIDNYIYDIVLAQQYLSLTNSSTFDLGKIVYDNNTLDYIQFGIEKLYQAIKDKEIIELYHQDKFPSLSQSTNMNCSQNQIEDITFKSALTKMNVNYNKFFQTICEYYEINMLTSDNGIIKEILYMTNQLSWKYTRGSYEEILEYYHNRLEYDLYSGVLFFSRVIRSFFNEKFFEVKVDNILKSFSTLIIVYLILNMCLEIVIFLTLNLFVIIRIRMMTKKLAQFINSLKY